jgi:hypothetical protein
MATMYVAHDQFGQILSVAPEEGDIPVATSEVQVTEVPVSGEMERLEVHEVARRFRIDVGTKELVEGPLEEPRQA